MCIAFSLPALLASCLISFYSGVSAQGFPGMSPCLLPFERRARLRYWPAQVISRLSRKPLSGPGDCPRRLSSLPLSRPEDCITPELLRCLLPCYKYGYIHICIYKYACMCTYIYFNKYIWRRLIHIRNIQYIYVHVNLKVYMYTYLAYMCTYK